MNKFCYILKNKRLRLDNDVCIVWNIIKPQNNVISFPQIKIKLHQDGSSLNSMHGIHRNIEFFPAMQCCYKSENVTQMCFMALFARDVL